MIFTCTEKRDPGIYFCVFVCKLKNKEILFLEIYKKHECYSWFYISGWLSKIKEMISYLLCLFIYNRSGKLCLAIYNFFFQKFVFCSEYT